MTARFTQTSTAEYYVKCVTGKKGDVTSNCDNRTDDRSLLSSAISSNERVPEADTQLRFGTDVLWIQTRNMLPPRIRMNFQFGLAGIICRPLSEVKQSWHIGFERF